MQEILILINKEYFIIVILASVIALPVAYYFLENWLKGFIYKIDLDGFFFFFAVIGSLAVAMATVSINTLRAANSKIVTAIKH